MRARCSVRLDLSHFEFGLSFQNFDMVRNANAINVDHNTNVQNTQMNCIVDLLHITNSLFILWFLIQTLNFILVILVIIFFTIANFLHQCDVGLK